jgi:iron uptake system EfeUOB component EfeO/EfeM
MSIFTRAAAAPSPAIAGRRFATLGAAALMIAATSAQAMPLDDAAGAFRPIVGERIAQSLAAAKTLRDRVAAHDLAGAQHAWLAARHEWEGAEIVSLAFFPDLDAQIDASPDPKSGFHILEAKLFGAHLFDALPQADELVANLTLYDQKLRATRLTAQGLLDGATTVVYELGETIPDAGGSPYSGNSLAEIRDRIDAVEVAYEHVFAPALAAHAPQVGKRARRLLDQLQELTAVADLKSLDQPQLRKLSEELAVTLQASAAPLGLKKPNLEE